MKFAKHVLSPIGTTALTVGARYPKQAKNCMTWKQRKTWEITQKASTRSYTIFKGHTPFFNQAGWVLGRQTATLVLLCPRWRLFRSGRRAPGWLILVKNRAGVCFKNFLPPCRLPITPVAVASTLLGK